MCGTWCRDRSVSWCVPPMWSFLPLHLARSRVCCDTYPTGLGRDRSQYTEPHARYLYTCQTVTVATKYHRVSAFAAGTQASKTLAMTRSYRPISPSPADSGRKQGPGMGVCGLRWRYNKGFRNLCYFLSAFFLAQHC